MINGSTLRQLRTLKGLKQETIAEKLDISQPAYSKLEKRERINGEKLEQFLKALDYTREELEQAVQLLLAKK
jgi:transcriptional regulator with XRE-family HTH domain